MGFRVEVANLTASGLACMSERWLQLGCGAGRFLTKPGNVGRAIARFVETYCGTATTEAEEDQFGKRT